MKIYNWKIKNEFVVILIITIVYLSWSGYNSIHANSKINNDLKKSMEKQEKIELVIVQLNFEAEGFHIRYFQQFGRVTKVEGSSVYIRSIKSEDVKNIAKKYWVKKVQNGK